MLIKININKPKKSSLQNQKYSINKGLKRLTTKKTNNSLENYNITKHSKNVLKIK